jgi:hypothetical protein
MEEKDRQRVRFRSYSLLIRNMCTKHSFLLLLTFQETQCTIESWTEDCKVHMPQRSHEAGGLYSCTERGEGQAGLLALNLGTSVVTLHLQYHNHMLHVMSYIKILETSRWIATQCNRVTRASEQAFGWCKLNKEMSFQWLQPTHLHVHKATQPGTLLHFQR